MHHHLYLFILCFVLPLSYGEPLTYAHVKGSPYSVSYTSRAFLINGSPTVLLSGSVHYVRSTPAMWPGIFDLAVKNGLNTIETYVFWNYHEAERGVYDFSGRGDLLQFIQQAAEHNLFVNLRIGPYVCAEWDYGGFPLWLRDIPGIQFRTYNKPFMNEMANFVQYIVEMVRPYFASQGGNIILAQIENEYNGGPTEGNGYIAWCGELAASLDIGVPWMMCNGQYANNTIETCNACECDAWVATHWKEQPNTPPAWTENEGWFDEFGMAPQVRAASNLAYSVARYFAVGGAHMNYYMWHGGNNYGITGAATMTTRYANDVILDSMALPHEPKYSFSTSLHLLIAQYFRTMINYPPTPKNLTTTGVDIVDYNFISFVSNTNESFAETVTVSGTTLSLPPQTVIVIDNSNPPNILFNTSNVLNGTIPHTITESSGNFVWTAYTEPVGITLNNVIRNPTPFEHLVISQDKTDYVWYSAELTLANVGDFRAVSIMAHAYSLYFNGKFENVGWDVTKSCCDHINITVPVGGQITAGTYQVDVLSTSLGIENGGDNMELFKKGIVGDVFIGDTNVTLPPNNGWWTMQSGLVGEALEIYQPYNLDLVNWTSPLTANTPITWYTTTFPTPILPGTVAIDATGLGKGHLYVNGNALGRYWLLPGSCADITCCCYYFDTNSNCTLPTQYLYHVPPDWLNTIGPNVFTIFEELGAPDISTVKVVVVS